MYLHRRLTLQLLLCVVLSACGPLRAAESTLSPTIATPPHASPSPVPAFQGWRIGLTESPIDLYPYSGQRAASPILALLYPPPVLPVSGGALPGAGPALPYTTTGVLQELPTVANGGVVTNTTTVNLTEAGAITTTQTGVTTDITQLVVTYHWNPALHWSDGEPLTAEDSVFAYQVARAAAATPQTVRRLELTARYEAIDRHTSRAYLPPGLTDPDYLLTAWPPLPRHALADVPIDQVRDQLASSPLGYGPYTVKSSQSDELVLARRPDAAESYPQQVKFRFYSDLAALRVELLAGHIDIGVSEPVTADAWPFLAQDADNGALQVLSAPGAVWEHLDINLDREPFTDPRVRRALALGMDRKGWSKALLGGYAPVMDSWIGSDSWAFAAEGQEVYPYDPERARQLLSEAGLSDTNGDGIRELQSGAPFTATLLTSSSTALRQAIAEQFREEMGTLGISVTLRTLATEELYSPQGPLFQRQFTLALFGWLRAADPSGAVLWGCAAVPGPQNSWQGNNFSGWCHLEADEALREASSNVSAAQRRAAYARHQALFMSELPVIPLFTRPVIVLAQPEVRGLRPDAFAPLVWNIQDWRR